MPLKKGCGGVPGHRGPPRGGGGGPGWLGAPQDPPQDPPRCHCPPPLRHHHDERLRDPHQREGDAARVLRVQPGRAAGDPPGGPPKIRGTPPPPPPTLPHLPAPQKSPWEPLKSPSNLPRACKTPKTPPKLGVNVMSPPPIRGPPNLTRWGTPKLGGPLPLRTLKPPPPKAPQNQGTPPQPFWEP